MSDDDFERMLADLGRVLAFPENSRSPGADPHQSYAIDVVAIRQKTGLSQAAFALRIGVPVATIRNWEQGRRSPQGPARVLLALLGRNPRIVEETLAE